MRWSRCRMLRFLDQWLETGKEPPEPGPRPSWAYSAEVASRKEKGERKRQIEEMQEATLFFSCARVSGSDDPRGEYRLVVIVVRAICP